MQAMDEHIRNTTEMLANYPLNPAMRAWSIW